MDFKQLNKLCVCGHAYHEHGIGFAGEGKINTVCYVCQCVKYREAKN